MSVILDRSLVAAAGFLLGVWVMLFDGLFEGQCPPAHPWPWRVAFTTACLILTAGWTVLLVRRPPSKKNVKP